MKTQMIYDTVLDWMHKWQIQHYKNVWPIWKHPILERKSTALLLLLCMSRSGYPSWILKRGEVESSGQRLIFSIGKTKRMDILFNRIFGFFLDFFLFLWFFWLVLDIYFFIFGCFHFFWIFCALWVSDIRHQDFLLCPPSSITLILPPTILQRGGLESSGQITSS